MRPILSYCIPVQDRADDLRLTLRTNLDQNRPFQTRVEFVVVSFDRDDELDRWMRESFAADIASGYLKPRRAGHLDPWHFGRAKNVFRDHLEGAIYSSLDADNFVSPQETRQILDLHAEHGGKMLIHHFSGHWGDGTCGRVTLPANLYRSVGYDERALPRQFDEIDLILSALRADPDLTYISHLPGGALQKSKATAGFLHGEGMAVKNLVVDDLRAAKPLNPRNKGYADDCGLLGAMQRFNRASSFAKNAGKADSKERYFAEAMQAVREAIAAQGPAEALQCFFGEPGRPLPQLVDGKVPVFACVKDDTFVLEEWYRHYRRIGCGPFYIIDDCSVVPVAETLPYRDVLTLTPRVGHYRTCKSAWLMATMKAVLPEGRWALTVDADEFVDVPPALGTTMADVTVAASAAGRSWLPGMLVDMLPAASELSSGPARASFLRAFDRHLLDGNGDSTAYRCNKSVRWAFGDRWRASYCIDARYRIAGTIDVLRKVPLMKYRQDIRIHHGFHDFGYSDQPNVQPDDWRGPLLLPMRHYKLVKLFDAEERRRMAEHAGLSFVHDRKTTANLRTLVAGDRSTAWEKLETLETVEYDPSLFSDPEFFHAVPGMSGGWGSFLRRGIRAMRGKDEARRTT